MSSVPQISVVVRTYNCFDRKFPHDPRITIESIKNDAESSTLSVQIIVLDDCSTDVTPSLLACTPGVLFSTRFERRGPIKLLNAGLELATAPLLAYVDSDDVVLPGFLNGLAQPFYNPDTGHKFGFSFSDYFEGDRDKPTTIREVVVDSNPYMGTAVSGFMFRTDLLRQLGGYDTKLYTEEIYGHPEYEILMRIENSAKWKAAYVPRKLWTYMRSPDSLSRQSLERMRRGTDALLDKHGWAPKIRSYS